jgi:hypothetical protein
LTWLNQFGTIGTFLKNDIKLIKETFYYRIKRDVSFLAFFFTGGIESYNNPVMHILLGFSFPVDSNYFRAIWPSGTAPITS